MDDDLTDPAFEHGCPRCTFIGGFRKGAARVVDLYFCRQGVRVPRVVARYSSSKDDYMEDTKLTRSTKAEFREGWRRVKKKHLDDCTVCKRPLYGMGSEGCYERHVPNLIMNGCDISAKRDAEVGVIYRCTQCGAEFPTQGHGSMSRPCPCGSDAVRRMGHRDDSSRS